MPFFRWGLILLLLPPFLANAQEDAEETSQPWWEYGLHVGAFSADNFSAGFYNGTGDNDINRILENQYYYEEIYQELGQHFSPGELPQQMRYQIAAVPGLHLEYHFSESFSIFARLHYIKLKTSDVFTLKYDSVSYGTFDTYFIGNIYGTEERATSIWGYENICCFGTDFPGI